RPPPQESPGGRTPTTCRSMNPRQRRRRRRFPPFVPRRRILVISAERADHIWRHQITPQEAREAFEQGDAKRGPNSPKHGRTYIVVGHTYAGRKLWLLVFPSSLNRAILVTARSDPH